MKKPQGLPEQWEVQELCVPEKGWIRSYVDCYKGKVEVPSEAIAGTAYTLLSAIVGWKGEIRFADASEPLTLFTALIGRSASAHKTTSLKIAERIGVDANDRWRHHQGCIPEDPAALLDVVSGGHMSQAGILDVLAPKDEAEQKLWDSQPPPAHLMIWDELADLLTTDWNTSFLAATRQMLLRVYGGHQPGSNTRTNPTLASRCSMSILGTVTAATWEENLGSDAVASGMMGRILAIPYGAPEAFIPFPEPVDRAKRDYLVDWLVALGNLPQSSFGQVTMTQEARDLWEHWYLDKKNEIAKIEEKSPVMANAYASIFGRYQVTALKFAAILAVSEWEPGAGVPSLQLTHNHLFTACAYIDRLLQYSVPVAYDALDEAQYRHMRRVKAYVSKHDGCTYSEAMRAVRTKGVNAETFKRLLQIQMDQQEISWDQENGRLWLGDNAT